MNILLCPDKFKGSLTAEEVCKALHKGLTSVGKELDIVSLPMADGGDGSIDILKRYLKLTPIQLSTVDPLGRYIKAEYYHSDDTAFIELASASGITLLSESERNPLVTSTRGTGILLKDAIDRGFRKVYLFIGGSVTNDGGIGIANALGYDFLDKEGKSLKPTGDSLRLIDKIINKPPYELEECEINVLCDVTNPMYGHNGAAHIYGAQKGGSSKDIKLLDIGLQNYAQILEEEYHTKVSSTPGMGAAGAVGASLVGLLNATLQNGFQMLAEVTQLEEAIKKADLVITGEGKIDTTSFQGKVVGNVINLCSKYNTPYGLIAGSIEKIDEKYQSPTFTNSILSLSQDLNEAMAHPQRFLSDIGIEIGNQF